MLMKHKCNRHATITGLWQTGFHHWRLDSLTISFRRLEARRNYSWPKLEVSECKCGWNSSSLRQTVWTPRRDTGVSPHWVLGKLDSGVCQDQHQQEEHSLAAVLLPLPDAYLLIFKVALSLIQLTVEITRHSQYGSNLSPMQPKPFGGFSDIISNFLCWIFTVQITEDSTFWLCPAWLEICARRGHRTQTLEEGIWGRWHLIWFDSWLKLKCGALCS